MAEEKVRKTTAKKVVRRTTTKVAPRKTPVRKTAATSTASTQPATPVRKAPSRATVASVPHKKSSKKLIGVAVFLLVILGTSVAIGFSDKGQINVTDVIATRKQNATPEEKQAFETIPVQQSQTNVVNGGLVGSGDQSSGTPPPVEETAPAATTTEQVATSTEALPPAEEQEEQSAEESVEDAPIEGAQ